MTEKIASFLVLIFIMSGCGMKSKTDLINNYENKKGEITELKKYFNEIVPPNYLVRIRYNSTDNVDLIVYEPTSDTLKRELLFRKMECRIR